jgi:tRNA nucleotidyltransferase/poly(A) polymerase
LNGVEDLERGILRTPMNLEFFKIEVLRTIKTSAQYSMTISREIQEHMRGKKDNLKKFYRENPSWIDSELAKMLHLNFSPKAWKLLYDFDFIDILISDKLLPIYEKNKINLRNKIFNVAVLSHFIYLQRLFKKVNLSSREIYHLYKFTPQIVMNMNPKKNDMFRSYFNNTKLNKPHNLNSVEIIIISSEFYCLRYDCQKNLLKDVNVSFLSKIINKVLELNK